MHVISAPDLRRFVTAILEAAATPPDVAALAADSRVEANLAGHDSHGVIRVSQLVAILTALIMAAVLIIQSRRPHPPEKMFVNRAASEAKSGPEADNIDSEAENDINKEDNTNVGLQEQIRPSDSLC